MPTSRDLKSGDLCHSDQRPFPNLHNQPLLPPKRHPLSFNMCVLKNPRCRNALRNGETSLKNSTCYNLESLRSAAKFLKYKKVQSGFYLGDLVTRTGDREIRFAYGRIPDNLRELA